MDDVTGESAGIRRATRIPDGLPFAVHPNRGHVVGYHLLLCLWPLIPIGVSLRRHPPEDSPAGYVWLAVLLGTALLLVAGSATAIVGLAFGGPLLGCDDEGVWLRVGRIAPTAVRLPWDRIHTIDCRRSQVRVKLLAPLNGRCDFRTSLAFARGRGPGAMPTLERYAHGRCEVLPP